LLDSKRTTEQEVVAAEDEPVEEAHETAKPAKGKVSKKETAEEVKDEAPKEDEVAPDDIPF